MRFLFRPLTLGMLVGLVTGPVLTVLLSLAFVSAADYRALSGDDWPWVLTGIINLGFMNTPAFLLIGGIVGVMSRRLNSPLSALSGGLMGALSGWLISGGVEAGGLLFGPLFCAGVAALCGAIVGFLARRAASAGASSDWRVDF